MKKVFENAKGCFFLTKRKGILVIAALMAFAVVLSAGMIASGYSENINKDLADNLIRLHVIANSDKSEDQELKRNVRDAVVEYMKNELRDSRDIEETKYIINRDMLRIEELAEKQVQQYGKNYDVKVMFGTFPFPTKAYGDIVLPAGNYQALRVVIGDGAGANWWCVLFPPLCFVDASHGIVSESVKKELSEVLGEEDYKIITSTGSESVPIKIKFKTVEIFQKYRIKILGIFNKNSK